MRKIIQIAVASDSCYTQPFALCSDGTVWAYQYPENEGWHKLPPIPQGEDEKTTSETEGGK